MQNNKANAEALGRKAKVSSFVGMRDRDKGTSLMSGALYAPSTLDAAAFTSRRRAHD